MNRSETILIEEINIENVRFKTTERDCPACDALLVLNENEQCFECLNCGYIDCGDKD